MANMTALQRQVLDGLTQLGGSASAAEIAAQIDAKPRSVAIALCWLRGDGKVSDGSETRPLYSGRMLISHLSSRPKGTITWSIR